MLILSSCSKDDEAVVSIAQITVTENGSLKSGITVYMFGDSEGPSTNFFTPTFSDKTVVTENNGVATFDLQEIFNLNVIDSQTTLYFGVFDNNRNSLGSTAITERQSKLP